jgi:hypothetical protein
MSSQSEQRTEFIDISYNCHKEGSINFNKIIIPFSNFGISKAPKYIYEGNEKIVFEERLLIYKSILLDEFVH